MSPYLENVERSIRCWVTHSEVASQRCNFHVKPSQMDQGLGRGGLWLTGGVRQEDFQRQKTEREKEEQE